MKKPKYRVIEHDFKTGRDTTHNFKSEQSARAAGQAILNKGNSFSLYEDDWRLGTYSPPPKTLLQTIKDKLPHISLRPKPLTTSTLPPTLLSGTGKTRVIRPVTLTAGGGASRSTGLKSVKVGQVFHTNAGGGTVLSRRSLKKTRRRKRH